MGVCADRERARRGADRGTERRSIHERPEVAAVDPATIADDEARGVFSAGQAAYAAGRFEDAYGYFGRAYELSPRPELLYNLGLAAASAGHEREAVRHFEAYLAAVPDARNRVIVEARLASMRAELAEEDAVNARLAEAESRASSSGAAIQRDAGWGLVVTGTVLAVSGGVLYGVGVGDLVTVESAGEGTPWPSLRDAASRAPILTGVGGTVGLVGVAALGVGLGLLVSATEPPRPAAVRVVPSVDLASGAASITVGGSF